MLTRAEAPIVSVAVIGAGLAGAACARALSSRGFKVTLFEREDTPACGASGNPMGILHPLVSADHNLASQWVEAGLETSLRWLEELEQFEQSGGSLQADAIGSRCAVLQMNADCSELVSWTPNGAWMRPAKFVQACLAQAQSQGAQLFFNSYISSISEYDPQQGVVLARSDAHSLRFDAVVVANGQGAADLLPDQKLAFNAIRGKISAYQVSEKESLPCIICANGYATPVIDGLMTVGASYERIDDHGRIEPDPVSNLDRLAVISSRLADLCGVAQASERTSIRIATQDRMPHVGRALNHRAPLLPSVSQLHQMPRLHRVWVLAGLGSRGLSSAPLAAELIAGQMAGESLALEQRLLDSVDPVRFALRQHQRRAADSRSC